ncbi:MAG: tetratricopeptide repeat protein [Bacteroidetes bacterium]|nr:tetratricopeptide repeat protein [Bacteroidota bacterium]
MKKISYTILLSIAVFLLSSCVTQKRKGDLSTLGKIYHNTTARYNGYFNANELLIASTAQLSQDHEDNYNKVLDIYKYTVVENPKSAASDLDNAIEKVSVVVSLHRESHWADDCYLLIGKAQYLKQDYESSEETLEYLLDEYSLDKMRARASKVSKKKSGSKKKKGRNTKTDEKDTKNNDSKKASSSSKDKKQKTKSQKKLRKEYNKEVKKNQKKRNKGKKTSSSRTKPSNKVPKDEIKEKTTEKPVVTEEEPVTKPSQELIKLGTEVSLDPGSDPESYFMKHRPAYQEGVLWLARTYIEREKYQNAERLILQLDRDSKTFKDVRSELAVVQAYYYMKQKNPEKAIAPLEKAVKLADSRQDKARYTYIIAQIHQQANRGDAAYVAYERALKFGPSYDMAFNSRLNMISNSWQNGKATIAQAEKDLQKMLKDEKNIDYKDQIYYTMAIMAMQEGDKQKAIENYRLSLRYNRNNRYQKAESYLQLAKLYYEDEMYVEAKHYYDSTMQVMTKVDERYDEVARYSNSLTDIAANIETIQLQDSLLRISKMSEEDKKVIAFEIKKKQEEERRKKLAASSAGVASKFGKPGAVAASRSSAGGASAARVPTGALQKESNFFAYNDKALKRGVRDFERKWGNRQLEDNWRRSNRSSISDFDEDVAEEEIQEGLLTEEDIKKILSDVPNTKEQVDQANQKIMEALFALGVLYRERIDNNEKAVQALLELNQRFPGNPHELDSWYYLYMTYKDLKDEGSAKNYYDKIIAKYPESTYARILQDPSYVAESLDENRRLMNYYNETYDAFKRRAYEDAFTRCAKAKDEFGAKNPLEAKFALLSALCTGNIKGKETYKIALKDVIAKYPQTDEQKRAKEILRLLDGKSAEETAESRFKADQEKLHYIMIIFDDPEVRLTDAKAKVSDYHRQYHKLDKLRISNIYLGDEIKLPVIIIRRFKTKDNAMKYYNGVKKNEKDYINQKKDPFVMYPVTQNNYREILKTKSLDGYEEFFQFNYLD